MRHDAGWLYARTFAAVVVWRLTQGTFVQVAQRISVGLAAGFDAAACCRSAYDADTPQVAPLAQVASPMC